MFLYSILGLGSLGGVESCQYIEFYQDVHQIVATSTAATDSVYLLNVQFLNLANLAPGD